ncbi:jg8856 [Pararge aegeria aegeria]|uniref:Jg8856 protein n=1 Tax=Pararge aegeria aegeria TaxID=348720 RepID=A0A8S4R3J5_9NEOP|nr:jg8856 [Pararge aegeria aegeria]
MLMSALLCSGLEGVLAGVITSPFGLATTPQLGEPMDVGVPKCWSVGVATPHRTDDIKRVAESRCIEAAQNPGVWSALRYVKQWRSIG